MLGLGDGSSRPTPGTGDAHSVEEFGGAIDTLVLCHPVHDDEPGRRERAANNSVADSRLPYPEGLGQVLAPERACE